MENNRLIMPVLSVKDKKKNVRAPSIKYKKHKSFEQLFKIT